MMILVAAVLLAATSIIQSYYARRGLLMEAEQRAQREMLVSRLRIENVTGPIEGAARNTSWMVEMNLAYPDTLFSLLRNVVEANPLIADVAVAFLPNYYKDKGYWFEPLVARREGNVLEAMVLGSPSHDYLSSEWFTTTVRSGQPYGPYILRFVFHAHHALDRRAGLRRQIGLQVSSEFGACLPSSRRFLPAHAHGRFPECAL